MIVIPNRFGYASPPGTAAAGAFTAACDNAQAALDQRGAAAGRLDPDTWREMVRRVHRERDRARGWSPEFVEALSAGDGPRALAAWRPPRRRASGRAEPPARDQASTEADERARLPAEWRPVFDEARRLRGRAA